MPEEPEVRASRLFGVRGVSGSGGLLLPEIFGKILEILLSGPQPADVLHKIIREVVSYKEERILHNWESWEAFCNDILLILSDNEWITEDEGSWFNTDKVIPETQLTIVMDPGDRTRRVRVTVHDTANRERLETVAEAWQRAGEFTRWLRERSEISPVLEKACNKASGITDILMQAVQSPALAAPPGGEGPVLGSAWRSRKPGRPRKDGRPVLHGQNDWYRQWVRTIGWHSQADARRAWNSEFPDKYLRTEQASAFRHEAAQMIAAGEMEWNKGGVGERGIAAHQYRWTGEDK